MRQWTSGVSIVCSQYNGLLHGMTVNSFASVSLNPPRILVTLAKDTRTGRLVQESGIFSVSILNQDQRHLADIFSGKIPEEESRFHEVETILLPSGVPAIKGALAVFDCIVRDKIPLDNSTTYLAEVTYTAIENQGKPLVYHNRDYWTI